MASRQATMLAVALVVAFMATATEGQGCVSDMIVALDASSTVDVTTFNIMKGNLEFFINDTFLSYPNTRIGLIIFGTSVTTSTAIYDVNAQLTLLNALSNAQYSGGSRNTNLAFDTARATFNSQARNGSPRDLILITIGLATDGNAAVNSASLAQASNINIYALGIEAALVAQPSVLDSFRQQLAQFAPTPQNVPSRVIQVSDINTLPAAIGNLVPSNVCLVRIVQSFLTPVSVFTTETIILSVGLNQEDITAGFWTKDGATLAQDNRFSTTVDNAFQRLIIVNAQTSDAGTYTFTVGAQETSNTVTVNAVIVGFTRSSLSYIGQSVTMTIELQNGNCQTDGVWTKDGNPISLTGRLSYTIQPGSNCRFHVLTINPATSGDAGTYRFTYQQQTVIGVLTIADTSVPVDGGFSEWTTWSGFQCSVTCGQSATRQISRTRECNSPIPQSGGANCVGDFTQTLTISCGFIGCPVNGGLTQWTQWNGASVQCPQSCGTNAVKYTERRRTCTQPRPQFGGVFCSGILYERRTETCGLTNVCPTPVNGGVTNWSFWTNPSCSVTCGVTATKAIQRTRECTNPPPSGGGLNCLETLTENALVNCALVGCPVNGGVSEWGAWNDNAITCPQTCGFSATKTTQRFRTCTNPVPLNGGQYCTESLVESRTTSCGFAACQAAVNGGVGQWSSWNAASVACSVTCGTNAIKDITRTRQCNNPPPSNGGRDCLDHLVETTQVNCGLTGCPINGGVGQWESWNSFGITCPFTCGVAAQKQTERIRRCNNPPPSNGGAACTESLFETRMESCNTPACAVPVNGGVGNWGAWAIPACGVTCGDAFRNITRSRLCNNPAPSNGGSFCSDPLSETSLVSCGLVPCPINGGVGQWAQWSAPFCGQTCGPSTATGRSTRTRLCNNPTPLYDGLFCTENLSETMLRNCNYNACPVIVDGGVSVWGQWSDPACSVTCGTTATKVVTRNRICNNPPPSNGGRTCTQIGFLMSQTANRNCQLTGCPVNGGISQWTQWNVAVCTLTCGLNVVTTATRQRFCNSPAPQNNGFDCTESREETEIRSCALAQCPTPVNGGLSLWSQWAVTPCATTCGTSQTSLGTRVRSCSNPPPRNGGADCVGDRFQTTAINCNLPACPINGGYTQWAQWNVASCGVTCGLNVFTTATRFRTCSNPTPSDGGSDCSGLGASVENQQRSCNLQNCPINGGLGQWTQWNVPSCAFTCGSSITRTATRFRLCNNPSPAFGGNDCSLLGSLSESQTRACNLPSCAINGGLSLWTQWQVTPCTATCGSFTTLASRARTCTNPPPSDGGADCTGLGSTLQTQSRACNLQLCPIDGGLSAWGQWNIPACSVTCGTSEVITATRFRTCTNPAPSNGGSDCSGLGPTSDTTSRSCNLNNCPINGGLGQWTQWNVPSCALTCGSGLTTTATRVRFCNSPSPAFGGLNCSLLGALSESQARACNLPSCAINGGLSLWTQWQVTPCTASCGSFTTLASRARTCTNPPPSDGGADCTGLGSTLQTESRACNLQPCPIDGGLSAWGQWNIPACSVTCGTSEVITATRFRTCTNPAPSNGGSDCSGLGPTSDTTSRSCNLNNCPIDGGLGQWTQWNVPSCAQTCGSTLTRTATRARFCNNPTPAFGGRTCALLGALTESQSRSCNLPSCPINGAYTLWSQWSVVQCFATCGPTVSTTASRFRTCTNPPPTDGGNDCTLLGASTQSESRSCNLPNCPINGGLSQWTQWTVAPCTATCGSSALTSASRTRSCTNPVPQFGGNSCTGNTIQSQQRTCNLPFCPINGGYSPWSAWNTPSCLVTCGTARTRTISRSRTCTNPSPQFGGFNCTGDNFESFNQNCGLPSCALDGGISQWTAWVNPTCIVTCGQDATYIAYRQRFCNNPTPRDGGSNCTESRWDSQQRNCGLPSCPLDGGVTPWTQWTGDQCTQTCGRLLTRVLTRFRTCNNPSPANGGSGCTAQLSQSEVRNCNLPSCPINGGVSQWTNWAVPTCSRTCGSTLTRTATRVRFCNSPYPQYGGFNCSQTLSESQSRPCGLSPCRVDGGLTVWTQWARQPCGVTCGINVVTQATRTRSCTNPIPTDGGANCIGPFSETTTRGCNLNYCPINGGLTQWTEWSVPECLLTCGTNRFVNAHRYRSCTSPTPRYGGFNCTGSLEETESRSCNISPCPVDGGLTQWSSWVATPCPVSCGSLVTRSVSRTRTCTNPAPGFGGLGCTGGLFETETRSCGLPNCPVDGGISQWTQWSDPPCQITCGPSARKIVTRTRVCNNPTPEFGGRVCTESSFEYEERSCNLGNCPVNGGVTLWSEWDVPDCSVTCGVGISRLASRARTCTNPAPQFGGLDCTELLIQSESRACSLPQCPINGGLTQWTSWNNPPCPVTCGTAAWRRVSRVRSCTNPVPQNGGEDCGNATTTEEEIRSCGLQRCPIDVIGLCQQTTNVNGVGYRYHPTDCDKYLQCYFNPNGYIIGVYRSCPFGFYWDSRTLRCDHPWKVNCPLEKCKDNCTANYNMEGSCRAHWICDNGISRADCCPMGFRYVTGQGCRPDFYCRDPCPTPCASRDVCDKRPDWSDQTRNYNISVGLLGWLQASCVVGNYFSILDCGCNVQPGTCQADYAMTFDNDNALMDATSSWLSMRDVNILNGYAIFDGIGHMFVNITQKAPATDCPLVIRFRFSEGPNVGGRRILASTNDCYMANSLVIAYEQNDVVFEMKSVPGQIFRMPISLSGFSNLEWKTVTMVYDGEMIVGVVESDNLKYIQALYAPQMNLMECGMRFASDGSMSTTERFIGSMDSFSVYRCNPGNLY